MAYLWVVSRCLLALVFAVSAGGKLRDRASRRAFGQSVREMRLVPRPLAGLVAGLVIAAETVTAAALVLPGPPVVAAAGLALAALLLTGFLGAIGLVLRRGRPLSCRCFGVSSVPLGAEHLVRNGALLAAAAAGLAAWLAGAVAVDRPMLAVAVPGAAVLALLVVRLDDLVALFRPATG